MKTSLNNQRAGVLLVVVSISAFLLASVWIVKSYVAQVLARKPTIGRLTLAIKLDPRNSQYHLLLGRLYEYAPTSEHPEEAMQQFERAAELSPRDPGPWVELAAASEFQGNVAQARNYLQRADFLAPHLAEYQWPIGNFYLLHGDTDQAFRHFRVVLAGTREYDRPIFHAAWKASGDPTAILRDLIPDDTEAEFSYLYFLLGQQKYAEAEPLWARIMSGSGSFTAEQAAGYVDALLSAHKPEQAERVWTDLESKGIVPSVTSGPAGNLVTNGSFEDKILNFGFGWRISKVEGVYAGLDTSNFRSPSHAIFVEFSGKQNIDYRQIFQFVSAKPATPYHLQAFMRTSGITTDSGPRLEVRDAYDGTALDQFTPSMTGNSEGWTAVSLDFKTGPKTELLVISLVRLPSEKLDNLISGKVWLDDVSLTPLNGKP